MVFGRRRLVRLFSVTALTACLVALTGIALAAPSLWECNFCHQQYQGESMPAALRFAKCPAKEMKQNHWWIKKN